MAEAVIAFDRQSRTALLIRSHYFDAALGLMVDRFQRETGLPVWLVLDQSAGPIEVPSRFATIRIDRAMVVAAGLVNLERWGWQCGDYFLILAQQALPAIEFFWMIEPDVLINYADLSAFFGVFTEDRSDLWVATFGPHAPEWFWYNAMRRFWPGTIGGCFFPLLRISARLIEAIGRERRAMTRIMGLTDEVGVVRIDPALYPNDEALTAALALTASFVARDFREAGVLYNEQTYRLGQPFLAEELAQSAQGRHLYHPVRNGVRADEGVGERVKSFTTLSPGGQ